MPKYSIHHIVLREAVAELSATGESDNAAAIQAEMPSATIGSIGPDLFFWGPDYEVVKKLYRLYKNIQEVMAIYNKIVQPIRDVISAVGEPVEEAVETLAPNTVQLIKKLLEEIKETAELFKAAVGTGIFAGVLSGANLLTDAAGVASLSQEFFQLFVPDLQKNREEKNWYWFDMLHYRQTGKFAMNLNARAVSARQKAFAFGYLSHIATDVTGHPFVNMVAGTTYRMNVQRHVTAENFMDTWKHFQHYGENINQTLFTRLGLPDRLPMDIGDQLFKAFQDTYANEPHPRRLPGDGLYTRDQIDETYEMFYTVLEILNGAAVKRPEEPFSGVADILSDALDSFSPPPSPPSSASSSCGWEDVLSFGLTEDSRECYNEFFEQVEDWLNYLGELLIWSLETLRNLIDLLLTLLLSLPIAVLLAILYGIQLMCYEIYRTARSILSINGFVFPEPDELDSSIGRNMITPYQCLVANFKTFPSIGTPARNNLICPVNMAEQPPTAAAFHPAAATSTPDIFIRNEVFAEQVVKQYAGSQNPDQTRSLERDRLSIGNAVAFTRWMIQNANSALPDVRNAVYANWNLDADRGYGYLSWKGTIPERDPYSVANEGYLG